MVQTPQFDERIPSGDDRPRLVCSGCGFIQYVNPKVIVGAVCAWNGEILLCQRAIPPRVGFWTIPAGFMEEGETPEEGAVRETLEESGARIRLTGLLGIYSIPSISQVQLIYRATLLDPGLDPGPESLAARFFSPADIPWDNLAFPSVTWALRHHFETGSGTLGQPFVSPERDPAWVSDSEQQAAKLHGE